MEELTAYNDTCDSDLSAKKSASAGEVEPSEEVSGTPVGQEKSDGQIEETEGNKLEYKSITFLISTCNEVYPLRTTYRFA